MKFLTFKTSDNNEIRFGFKHSESIIDIGLAAKWLYENYNDDRFIKIPATLHKSLKNWDENFKSLKIL